MPKVKNKFRLKCDMMLITVKMLEEKFAVICDLIQAGVKETTV